MHSVVYVSLKEELGDGNCISSMLMLAHMDEVESPDVALGLDETILHESIEVCCDCGMEGCHQGSAPVELGRSGVGRTTSSTLGGGGRRGKNKPMMADLTSSLLPPRSSPAPSSSIPSKAFELVR